MARPKTVAPPASAILALGGAGGRIALRVSPGASCDAIALPASGEALIVRTTARAENGKANEAVLRLLAAALDLPVSALALERGTSSRTKLVRILA